MSARYVPEIAPMKAHRAKARDRVVLADWWEENGQPNVAAFYRSKKRTLLGSMLIEALCRGEPMKVVDMKRFIWTLSKGRAPKGGYVGGYWDTNLHHTGGMEVLARFFEKTSDGYVLKKEVLDFDEPRPGHPRKRRYSVAFQAALTGGRL